MPFDLCRHGDDLARRKTRLILIAAITPKRRISSFPYVSPLGVSKTHDDMSSTGENSERSMGWRRRGQGRAEDQMDDNVGTPEDCRNTEYAVGIMGNETKINKNETKINKNERQMSTSVIE
jgi:hypothetical protein